MSRKSILGTALIAAATTMGIGHSSVQIGVGQHRYSRRRDDLPDDVQKERIRKAQEKRERKKNARIHNHNKRGT